MDTETLKFLVELKKNFTNQNDIDLINNAINAVAKQIPKKPIIERWSPVYCPNCDAELSEFLGDGYYKHYEDKSICECGQKLKWY